MIGLCLFHRAFDHETKGGVAKAKGKNKINSRNSVVPVPLIFGKQFSRRYKKFDNIPSGKRCPEAHVR